MSPLYTDLQRHMALETQQAMNRVARSYIGVIEPSELFVAMIKTGVDTMCSAVGSLAASTAEGTSDRRVDPELVSEVVAGCINMLRGNCDQIVEKANEEIARRSPVAA